MEERALKRNFEESMRRGEPDEVRIEKIEALLRHIENEEKSMETDVHFLHEANPSSVTLAVEASQQMVDLYRRGLKKVIGDSHPLGESVFVNHTHEDIERDRILTAEEAKDYGIIDEIIQSRKLSAVG